MWSRPPEVSRTPTPPLISTGPLNGPGKNLEDPAYSTRPTQELFQAIGYSAPPLTLLPRHSAQRVKKDDVEPLKHNWKLKEFTNAARNDRGFRLKHWERVPTKSSSEEEDEKMDTAGDEQIYPFSKYTIKSPVFTYTEEEYTTTLEDSAESGWTKEETDYLFSLLRDYELRFYIVADRYEWPGTPSQPPVKREIEDLKARYCEIARNLLRTRPPEQIGSPKSRDALVLRYGYDHAQEKLRRQHIAALWNRTPAQVAEESHLYTELLRLAQNEASFTSQRHSLLRLLAGIESGLPDITTLDDRLSALNLDPQIRGVKGGLWAGVLGGMGSAVPASASRKKRVGPGANASMDWGESPIQPTSATNNNMMISLGGSQRQLLPPAQQAEFDAKHHIYRAPPGSTLINSKNTHTPVHARSSKFPIPKPILASHLQSVSSTSSNGQSGSSSSSSSANANILAKVDIHPNKLALPTKENIELMEKVFTAATQWVELQKQLERVDAEVNAHKARLGIAGTGTGSSTAAGTKTDGETSAPATAETKTRRSSSRKRTLSASSSDEGEPTSNKRMKT